MSIWKSRVTPALKMIFDRDGKKAAASEFCKSFDKEAIGKEIDEKKADLEPKVLEVYEASGPEIKHLVKERKSTKINKKYSVAVTKFLEELVKIEFPGAQAVSEAVGKSGPTPVSGPLIFIFDKIATFIPKEEPKTEAPAETATREVVVEEEEKEETIIEAEKKEEEVKEGEMKTEDTPATSSTPEPATEDPAPEAEAPKQAEDPPKQ